MRRRVVLVAGAAALAVAACSSTAPPSAVHAAGQHAAGQDAAGQHAVTHHVRHQSGRPAEHVRVVPMSEKRVARPKPNRCARNDAAQKVIVSLAAQHMWMCAHHKLVRQSAVTTGMATPYTHTPTGNFWIQGRNRNTTLTLNTGATYAVKYWIPFQAPLFGFHDSSWQHFPYGSPKYKTDGSHGCVHMPLKAIAFLYRWAEHPTAVHIS